MHHFQSNPEKSGKGPAVQYLFFIPICHDAALADQNDTFYLGNDIGEVMGYHNQVFSLSDNPAQHAAELVTGTWVKAGGRFIQ